MRFICRMFVVLGLLVMAPDPARATLFGGTWVPVSTATAEYCLDGSCSPYPVDASIALAPPPSPGALVNSSLTIGFRPLGFEFFNVTFGSVVGEATLAAGFLTIRGSVPGFEEHDLTIRIVSDRALALDGFLHVTNSVGVFEVRFQDVGFVPVPEPSSAWMLGSGLAALARRRTGVRVSSTLEPRRVQQPAPAA